jgi:hypothetical protein
MSTSPSGESVAPLDERKFEHEQALKARELDLKEREIVAKEQELRQSRWTSPVVIGLFAAALGLFGNIYTARVNSQNAIRVERLRNQSNVLLEAIRTSDPTAACKNLTLLVKLQYIEDSNKTIEQACSGPPGQIPKGAPSLPAPFSVSAVPGQLPETGAVRVIDAVSHKPIADARLSLTGDDGMQFGVTTNDEGLLKSFLLTNRFPTETKVTITTHKGGYRDERTIVIVPPGQSVVSTIEMHPEK